MTKLRQKLKYRDQIENEKMIPDIIVTRGTPFNIVTTPLTKRT